MTLSQHNQDEILKELRKEGFPKYALEDTLQLIVLLVEYWRLNKDRIAELHKGDVVGRLIAKYAMQKEEIHHE